MSKRACSALILLLASCFNPPSVDDSTDSEGTGSTPATDTGTPPADDSTGATPSACDDGVIGGDETDVDCGGSCSPCGDGQGCATADDCSSGVCTGSVCQAPTCGDGVVQMGEACDDGGVSPTCTADCALASCGDGVVSDGEDCDDAGESATCNANCTTASCGDMVVNSTAGEACDDAGESKGCNADCTAAVCGDTIVNVTAGEDCDEGSETAACDADCTFSACGDGYENAAAGEICDDVGASMVCDDDCTPAMCGDGTINPAAGEECEGGPPDICTAACQFTGCGPDPVALAMALCMTQYPNCELQDGGIVGWADPSCTGCNCGQPASPWRWYCTETSDASNWNCSPCTIGQILGPHEPCACGAGTSPVLGSFCTL